MNKRSQRPVQGDVVAIPVSGGFSVGIWCVGNDMAFLNAFFDSPPSIDDLDDLSVAFRVLASDEPIRRGTWPKVGGLDLVPPLNELASYRNQPVGSNELYIWRAGQLSEAAVEEAAQLELMAIWDEKHIVERLEDHRAGRPNKTAEYFKVIKKYDPKTGQEIKR